jgi:hypothetical protein
MATCINKQGRVAEGSLLERTSSARRRIYQILGPLSAFLHLCKHLDLVKSSDSSATKRFSSVAYPHLNSDMPEEKSIRPSRMLQ